MTWLSLFTLSVKLAEAIFSHIERKQLMDSGEARALLAQVEGLNARVEKAAMARASVSDSPDELFEDDGYRKD